MKTTKESPIRTAITRKGQVVIPVKIRRRLGLKGGSQLSIYEQDGEIRMVPLTAETIEKNFGILKSGKGNATKILLEERKREQEGRKS